MEGGPHVDQANVVKEALRLAHAMGAASPTATRAELTTYRASAIETRHGDGTETDPAREAYVVYIGGAVTTRRGPIRSSSRTFDHGYWIFDAPTGDLIGWGSRP